MPPVPDRFDSLAQGQTVAFLRDLIGGGPALYADMLLAAGGDQPDHLTLHTPPITLPRFVTPPDITEKRNLS